MFFLQAAETPIKVQIGEMVLTIRKFTLGDAIEWAQQLYEAALEKQTEGMSDVQRREFMLYYRPASPDLQVLKAELRSPDGIKHVLRTCLPKAKVESLQGEPLPPLTLDQVERIIEINPTGRSSALAIMLADLDENSIANKPTEKEDIDPLLSTGKPKSKGSPGTGSTTSQSSTPHTQEKTPSNAP